MRRPHQATEPRRPQRGVMLLEVMVAPGARMAGHSPEDVDFKRAHNATVLAVHRRGEVLRERLRDLRLNVGDVLLLIRVHVMGQHVEHRLRAVEHCLPGGDKEMPLLRPPFFLE